MVVHTRPASTNKPAVSQKAGGEGENLSQEELLRQPVYIPHRTLKDPRAITMLDPACGSMHFGLYAFDLFERIYDEAWELEGERGPKALERAPLDAPLREAYPDKGSFLHDVPRLIVERSIHGVDIDPRAVQIAGLSLWLRAQKSWREQGLKPQERPQIRRSNVVCAEPMPGDKDLLEEFIARHLSSNAEDKVVAWMLGKVFGAMALAGEAGSLLKIEEEISAIVAEAKRQWRQGPKLAQSSFFADEAERITERALGLDASGITDATFWTRAEERIDAALKDYATFAEGDGAYRRRLFAGDAARGLAFIDLCRKRYDVVLMNPPFGAASAGWKATFERAYPRTKNDLYAAFVERGIDMQHPGGMLGAITSRTGFFLSSFQKWREEILLREALPTVFMDLGAGILDAAAVETAAYCLERGGRGPTTFFRLIDASDKVAELESALVNESNCRIFRLSVENFLDVPGSPFAYWVGQRIRQLFSKYEHFENNQRMVLGGLKTLSDERFLRAWWEVNSRHIGMNGWVPLAKGGAFSPYYSDLALVVQWLNGGEDISWYGYQRRPREGFGAASRGIEAYFRPGITWPRRTNGLSFRVLPANSIFGDKGPAAFVKGDIGADIAPVMAIMNSLAFASLVSVQLARVELAQSFEVGIIQRTPFPKFQNQTGAALIANALSCVDLKRGLDRASDISHVFHLPALLEVCGETLTVRTTAWFTKIAATETHLAAHQHEIDDIAFKLYGIDGEDRRAIEEALEEPGTAEREAAEADDKDDDDNEATADTLSLVAALMSYLVGTPLGRWDIRYATGERAAPDLPDPFAPLPVCPPGMLQNAQGLPAAPSDVPASYPLRISWPGILVDDERHPEDIVGRIREAIQIIWGERAEAIEQEACEILGVRSLREYFRKPALFFADHLQRYSKSRRQAPIYWPLSTPSGNYTLWLYYHRLTDQTLYSCVNDFVEPKLTQVRDELGRLRQKSGRTRADEKELERLTDLEQELQDLRAELLRVAAFWKPNLNDGVQITAAPLWKLFQHKPWQKRLKETWEKLEAGEYDWAHLAYSIWPERVREKCKNDKSLAIAHDLEGLYVEPPAGAKKGRGKKAAVGYDEGMFGEE